MLFHMVQQQRSLSVVVIAVIIVTLTWLYFTGVWCSWWDMRKLLYVNGRRSYLLVPSYMWSSMDCGNTIGHVADIPI